MRHRYGPVAAAAALALAAVAACSSGTGNDNGSTASTNSGPSALTTSTQASTDQWRGATINVLSWEGYMDPAWDKPFEEKYGVKINVTNVGSVKEMLTKASTSGTPYDIAFIDAGTIPRYVEQDLLLPINKSDVPTMAELVPSLLEKDESAVTIDGKLYGIPYAWAAVPMAVNTEKVNPLPDSWGALFDPKYKGHVVIQQNGNNVWPMVGLYLGFDDPFNFSAEQLDKAKSALLDQKKLVLAYTQSRQQAEQLFASGQAWLGYVDGSDVIAALAEKGFPIKEVEPKEGTPAWIDHITILKTTKHADLALALSDYLISAKVQAAMMQKYNYAVANGKVKGLVPDALLQTTHMDDAANFWAHLVLLEPPNLFEERENAWNAVMGG